MCEHVTCEFKYSCTVHAVCHMNAEQEEKSVTFRLVLSTWYQFNLQTVVCRSLESIRDCSKQPHVKNSGSNCGDISQSPSNIAEKQTRIINHQPPLFISITTFLLFTLSNIHPPTKHLSLLHGQTWLHYQPLFVCVYMCVSLHFLSLAFRAKCKTTLTKCYSSPIINAWSRATVK